jgi:hypothetical protein
LPEAEHARILPIGRRKRKRPGWRIRAVNPLCGRGCGTLDLSMTLLAPVIGRT